MGPGVQLGLGELAAGLGRLLSQGRQMWGACVCLDLFGPMTSLLLLLRHGPDSPASLCLHGSKHGLHVGARSGPLPHSLCHTGGLMSHS